MEVLRPAIIRINGRCYRKNPIEKSSDYHEDEEDFRELNTVEDAEEDAYDETCDAYQSQMEETSSGFRLALPIPAEFFKYLIGKKGETKKKLENETCTQIRIPRQGADGDVVVVGRDRSGVLAARRRIAIMVASARERQPFTHFLSVPVTAPSVRDKFLEFRDDVCRFCSGDRGVDATIFQTPAKLHLTLGTMVLLNDAEVNRAANLLTESYQEIVAPLLAEGPLVVSVRGLEYMNDDPCEVDVLYARVELQDGSDRLQQLSDALVARFTAAGVMQRGYERVKLHATVMNTLMRKEPSGAGTARGDGEQRRDRESFDATNVLRLYGDYNFGAYHIDNLQVSQRYSTGCDGYYACEAKLQL